jgi:hypothetical protein
MMVTVVLTTGFWVAMACFKAQEPSHIVARNTLLHRCPIASSREIPVIFSAARLKVVMRQSPSTVNTPSLIESRTGSRQFPCPAGAARTVFDGRLGMISTLATIMQIAIGTTCLMQYARLFTPTLFEIGAF